MPALIKRDEMQEDVGRTLTLHCPVPMLRPFSKSAPAAKLMSKPGLGEGAQTNRTGRTCNPWVSRSAVRAVGIKGRNALGGRSVGSAWVRRDVEAWDAEAAGGAYDTDERFDDGVGLLGLPVARGRWGYRQFTIQSLTGMNE